MSATLMSLGIVNRFLAIPLVFSHCHFVVVFVSERHCIIQGRKRHPLKGLDRSVGRALHVS